MREEANESREKRRHSETSRIIGSGVGAAGMGADSLVEATVSSSGCLSVLVTFFTIGGWSNSESIKASLSLASALTLTYY